MPSPWSCARRPAVNTNLSPLLSSLPLFASSLTPSLLQGRPLREQQELAAAVIQRCYKKYKQVSSASGRNSPVYLFSLVSSNVAFVSFFHKLTWIALKVIWPLFIGHTVTHVRRKSVMQKDLFRCCLDVHAPLCPFGSMHFIRR